MRRRCCRGHFLSGQDPRRSAGLSSLILSNCLSLVEHMVRSRCISGENSRTYLRRRNCVQQLSSRPTDNNIKEPVDATDFVHVACSCSFVTYPTDWEFRERLRSVLDTLLEPGRQQLPSPLSQLEALCVHIMRQIPEGVLLSVPLLLCHLLAMLAGLAANNFWLPSVAASSCSPSLR